MAQFADLDQEQQASLLRGTLLMRRKAGEFARLVTSLKPLLVGSGSAYIDGLVAGLDDNALIPVHDPQSEFTGAVFMTKARYQELKSLASAIIALQTNSIEAACVEAVGPIRVIS